MQTVDYLRFGLQPGDVVLDLGCGEGRHTIAAYAGHEVTVIGVDLGFADLQTARQRMGDFDEPANDNKHWLFMQSNGLHLPFADQAFDKVICSEVLEHVPDYEGMLREINRVLKPGGFFCASVPRFWPEWLCWALSDQYHANEGGHIRIFSARRLQKKIEALGFGFRGRHWAHALHSPFWWLKCVFWDSQDQSRLVKAYHRLLVWDLMERPWLTRTLERGLNPVMGKSVVMYFCKEPVS
ncbi:MAG: class I SAM-dependent methyltransferase [Gammaproteobacteria bacterium]|nr:MAG: class I SAM-dependent methyltransferase [Gammaproteobacteria bacterium]